METTIKIRKTCNKNSQIFSEVLRTLPLPPVGIIIPSLFQTYRVASLNFLDSRLTMTINVTPTTFLNRPMAVE